jgi:hypothetical protein
MSDLRITNPLIAKKSSTPNLKDNSVAVIASGIVQTGRPELAT